MATPNVLSGFTRCRRAPGMGDVRVIEIAVAASQTINIFDMLTFSSGKVQQAIAAPAAAAYTITNGLVLVGMAMGSIVTDASGNYTAGGVTQTTIPVAIADDGNEFLYQLVGATATGTSNLTTLGLLSEVQDITIPTNYSLGRYTSAQYGSFYFLSKSTTTPELIPEEMTVDFQRALATTQFPTLWCKVAQAYRALG